MTARDAEVNDDPSAIVAPTGLEFELKETKLHVVTNHCPASK